MKKAVNIPVIAVGSLNPKLAEQVLQEEKADMIAFGRALIADPFMPKKLKEGRQEDIRPCIRGNEGCISRFYAGCAIRCEVNPACGQEAHYRIRKAKTSKKSTDCRRGHIRYGGGKSCGVNGPSGNLN